MFHVPRLSFLQQMTSVRPRLPLSTLPAGFAGVKVKVQNSIKKYEQVSRSRRQPLQPVPPLVAALKKTTTTTKNKQTKETTEGRL